jgi:hypothetical protein
MSLTVQHASATAQTYRAADQGRLHVFKSAQRPAAGWSSKAAAALSGSAAAPAALAARRGRLASSLGASGRVAAPAVVAAAAGSAGTVAVTGATGLVGSALVKQLLADGFAVRVLTRNVVAARGKLPYPGIQFVAPAQWAEAVCGTTAVVNLAGGQGGRPGSLCTRQAAHLRLCVFQGSGSGQPPAGRACHPPPTASITLLPLQASPSPRGGPPRSRRR